MARWFWNVHPSWWRIEFLGIVRPCIVRSSRKLRKIAAKTGSTCRSNFNWMRCLLLFSRTGTSHCRGMLNWSLMSVLGILRSINNIKVVLVLPTRIRILSRMKNLFLLELLLKHDLCLWLVSCRPSILKCLWITSGGLIMLEVISGPGSTPIVLRRLVPDHLLFQFENISRFRCWWHWHDRVLLRAPAVSNLVSCQRCLARRTIYMLLLLIRRSSIIIRQLVYQIPYTPILQLNLLHLGVLVSRRSASSTRNPTRLIQLTFSLPMITFLGSTWRSRWVLRARRTGRWELLLLLEAVRERIWRWILLMVRLLLHLQQHIGVNIHFVHSSSCLLEFHLFRRIVP